MRLKISLVLVAILLSWACNSSHSPLTPSETPNEHFVDPAPVVPTGSSNPTFGNSTDEPGGCEVVSIERKGIRTRTDGLTLYIFVPASSTFGLNPYVDVWTENVNETKLGRGPANEEFSIALPEYRTYKIQLAVEVAPGGKVYQCDRHRLEITPTPPGCVPEFTQESTIEYGEWSECQRIETQSVEVVKFPGIKTRSRTESIFKVNSCDGSRELVDTREEVEQMECEIECVVQWTEIDRSTSYRGECEERLLVTTIVERNSCNGTTRQREGVESAPEDCRTCEEIYPAAHDNHVLSATHFNPNLGRFGRSNPFAISVDVHNYGSWTLRIHATSKLSEYQAHDPDYTKKTRSFSFDGCGEQSKTLSATYNWRGHNSRYWYYTLTGPDGIFYKSPVVDGR